MSISKAPGMNVLDLPRHIEFKLDIKDQTLQFHQRYWCRTIKQITIF